MTIRDFTNLYQYDGVMGKLHGAYDYVVATFYDAYDYIVPQYSLMVRVDNALVPPNERQTYPPKTAALCARLGDHHRSLPLTFGKYRTIQQAKAAAVQIESLCPTGIKISLANGCTGMSPEEFCVGWSKVKTATS